MDLFYVYDIDFLKEIEDITIEWLKKQNILIEEA